MGATTSVYDAAGKLQPYHYPYHLGHKVWQFPWKFYFVNGKFIRLVFYGALITSLGQFRTQMFLRGDFMSKYWKEKRADYQHTFFSPPRPPRYDRPPKN